jgi:hypothetical protein
MQVTKGGDLMNYRIEDLEMALAELHQQELRAAAARNRLIAQVTRQRREEHQRPRLRRTLSLLALAIGRALGASVRAATRPKPFATQRRDSA